MGDDDGVLHGGQRCLGVAGAHQVNDTQHCKLVDNLACAAHQAQCPQRLCGKLDIVRDLTLDLNRTVAGQHRDPEMLFNGFQIDVADTEYILQNGDVQLHSNRVQKFSSLP